MFVEHGFTFMSWDYFMFIVEHGFTFAMRWFHVHIEHGHVHSWTWIHHSLLLSSGFTIHYYLVVVVHYWTFIIEHGFILSSGKFGLTLILNCIWFSSSIDLFLKKYFIEFSIYQV